MAQRNDSRNELLVEMHLRYPKLPMSYWAEVFEISRQRAHQIIQVYKREQAIEEHLIIPVGGTDA